MSKLKILLMIVLLFTLSSCNTVIDDDIDTLNGNITCFIIRKQYVNSYNDVEDLIITEEGYYSFTVSDSEVVGWGEIMCVIIDEEGG